MTETWRSFCYQLKIVRLVQVQWPAVSTFKVIIRNLIYPTQRSRESNDKFRIWAVVVVKLGRFLSKFQDRSVRKTVPFKYRSFYERFLPFRSKKSKPFRSNFFPSNGYERNGTVHERYTNGLFRSFTVRDRSRPFLTDHYRSIRSYTGRNRL